MEGYVDWYARVLWTFCVCLSPSVCLHQSVCVTLSVYVCLFLFVCVSLSVAVCLCMFICVCLSVWLCKVNYICLCLCLFLCLFVCVSLSVSICLCLCVFACTSEHFCVSIGVSLAVYVSPEMWFVCISNWGRQDEHQKYTTFLASWFFLDLPDFHVSHLFVRLNLKSKCNTFNRFVKLRMLNITDDQLRSARSWKENLWINAGNVCARARDQTWSWTRV